MIAAVIYYLSKKDKRRAIFLSAAVTVLLLVFLTFAMYKSATAPDTQCTTIHETTTTPPANLETATDYFLQGNYDYDIGNCVEAIADYTKSIKLDSKSPQTYNNRAYTYMRMQDYENALPDLDRAISLNSNYIQALMNRGDIHNYYYAIDRKSSVADYEKVIALGATKGTSVCGHYLLAKHNGWNLGTLLDLPSALINCQ